MTVYYLAGPMTGKPNFNRDAFVEAAAVLREQGHEILNPVEMDLIYGSWEAAIERPWQEHLARDVDTVVNKADGVILLDGWEESRGANLEVRLARTFGKPVYKYLRETGFFVLLTDEYLDGAGRVGDVPAPASHADAERSRGRGDDLATEVYDADGEFVRYEDDPQRHVFSTGGIKDNRGKAPLDLLPSAPLVAIAEILAFGARKYQPHNWRKGLPWPDTYASLQRHLLAWNGGEDLDPETGKSHLWHAGCQMLFLIDFGITGVGQETDTRWRDPRPTPGSLPDVDPITGQAA